MTTLRPRYGQLEIAVARRGQTKCRHTFLDGSLDASDGVGSIFQSAIQVHLPGVRLAHRR